MAGPDAKQDAEAPEPPGGGHGFEELLSLAAHDLRAPLRQIHTALDLFGRHAGEEGLDDKGRELIGIAGRAADRMTHLIEDLISLARLESVAGPDVPVGLDEVLVEAGERVASRLRDCGGELVLPQGLPAVEGDRSQLLQLFERLLENAVKYRSEERPLRIEVGGEIEGGAARVTVADNGIGIPPDSHQQVFELFTRLHGVGEYEGTGLGLPLVARIAARHGGGVELSSDGSTGSAFTVALPVAAVSPGS